MGTLRDLKGETFERLYVIERGRNLNGKVAWVCRCKCGKILTIMSLHLISGNTKSCGCLQKESATTHGKSKHKLYIVFCGMKGRCYEKKNKDFKYYGGRGIIVCDEWLNDFMCFYDWAYANGYKEGLTIDRENNDKNYTPSNCRWVTTAVNNSNRSVSKKD